MSAARTILVVGDGGREHALAETLRRTAPEAEIFVAPGNPGTAEVARNVPIRSDDLSALADFAVEREVDLTVVGPEVPLAEGIADHFDRRDLPLFGPVRAAARIESSKAFAKELMREHGVPTAEFRTFTDPEAAHRHVEEVGAPVAVKASGLAAGKGSLVCETREEAHRAVDTLMVEKRFGGAGSEVVVEGFLRGRELSVFFLTDGRRAVPLHPSRDHKRLREGGEGPNTGGMGAYSPVADGTPELVEEVRRTIALPVLEALAGGGAPFRGILYAGLMLTEDGPRVVEFNCRLGDPEAQVVLPLIRGDLVEPMLAVARGESLGDWEPEFRPGYALVTVMASGGYPGDYETGFPIHLPREVVEDPDVRVYHAGTARRDGDLVTAGGRVLGVTGLGDSLEAAGRRSRDAVSRIEFSGGQWRRDIGEDEIRG